MNLLAVTSGTWTITLIGWAIVFAALVVLVIIFTALPRLYNLSTERQLKKEGKLKPHENFSSDMSGEETAAIALTLQLYFNELHDEESGVITIKRIRRRYSPWSSKLYGLNNRNF